MKWKIWPAVILLSLLVEPRVGEAFCGFYVAKADTKIFNRASQVVLARDGDRTVITMVNDFKGDPREFAVVIPVPTLIERGQIHVGNTKIIDHLDAYTSPRLVEYFDMNPCEIRHWRERAMDALRSGLPESHPVGRKSLGVTVQASYTVGEYNIVILSAREGRGLEEWLKQNGYRIPDGATEVLASYIKQKMHFFVARVNLDAHSKLGFSYLRPLQVAYESPKFMLPIRLGTVNADGPQELFIYTLTRRGRVEPANYRSVRLPTGMELPVYVKGEFKEFYRAMFDRQVEKEAMRAVFLEYAWDMNWCDPCAADPLSVEELRGLGVFWLATSQEERRSKSLARDVFVTRMHVRYDASHFPEDLLFQETPDRSNFQARYVLRHPWKGQPECGHAGEYRAQLLERRDREAQQLAALTGWDINNIREKMGMTGADSVENSSTKPWWQRLWNP